MKCLGIIPQWTNLALSYRENLGMGEYLKIFHRIALVTCFLSGFCRSSLNFGGLIKVLKVL